MRKEMGGGDGLERITGGETVIKIHCMRKEFIFKEQKFKNHFLNLLRTVRTSYSEGEIH